MSDFTISLVLATVAVVCLGLSLFVLSGTPRLIATAAFGILIFFNAWRNDRSSKNRAPTS